LTVGFGFACGHRSPELGQTSSVVFVRRFSLHLLRLLQLNNTFNNLHKTSLAGNMYC